MTGTGSPIGSVADGTGSPIGSVADGTGSPIGQWWLVRGSASPHIIRAQPLPLAAPGSEKPPVPQESGLPSPLAHQPSSTPSGCGAQSYSRAAGSRCRWRRYYYLPSSTSARQIAPQVTALLTCLNKAYK